MMPVDRLTAEDQLMLWPDEIWPQEIGALAILDASSLPGPGGRFPIEALREVIAARLHLVPRFRQLLYVPRRGLGAGCACAVMATPSDIRAALPAAIPPRSHAGLASGIGRGTQTEGVRPPSRQPCRAARSKDRARQAVRPRGLCRAIVG